MMFSCRGQPLAATTHTMRHTGRREYPDSYGIEYGAWTPYSRQRSGPICRIERRARGAAILVTGCCPCAQSGLTRRLPEWQVWLALLHRLRRLGLDLPRHPRASSRPCRRCCRLASATSLPRRSSSRSSPSARGSGALRLTRANGSAADFVGLRLLLGGNGLVMLGERDVPSGLAALIVAVVPLCVVILWRFIFGERDRAGHGHRRRRRLCGSGRADRAATASSGERQAAGHADVRSASSLSWAIGTYFSKRVDSAARPARLDRRPDARRRRQPARGRAARRASGTASGPRTSAAHRCSRWRT